MVSHTQCSKVIKRGVNTFLIFIQPKEEQEENLGHVNQERLDFIEQYYNCFSQESPSQLPPEWPEDHRIDIIPGSSPPNRPPYRVNKPQQEIFKQVRELTEKRLVRPCSSPYCSLVLLVENKGKTYRTCIDYRALNKQTIKN